MGQRRRQALPLPQEGVSLVSSPETSLENQIPPSRPGGEGQERVGRLRQPRPAQGTGTETRRGRPAPGTRRELLGRDSM